jgi:threonine aldolase
VTARKSFGSDNQAGAHEAVLGMMAHVNTGDATAYGEDPWTQRACAEIRSLLRADGDVFLVFTGTAANVLGLSLLLRPHEAVICPQSAHLNVDECGAVERVLGSRLLPVPAPDGKLTPALIASRLGDRGDVHRAQPKVAAISQVTEYGTCYTLEELRTLRDFCRSAGLWLYADGARLANAAARLGCSLADIAGFMDVLSFGATKNGAVGAEAVVVMAEDLVGAAPFQRKQQMQLSSKMRYLAAQFLALLEDGLWLRNASHANLMASRLADGLRGAPGVELWQKVESNAVFASLDPAHIERLQREWHFYVWDEPAHVVRWMTAFDTSAADVDAFTAAVLAAASGGR